MSVGTLGTGYSIIPDWSQSRRLTQHLRRWLDQSYYLSRVAWCYTNSYPRAHLPTGVSFGTSTWPGASDTSRPAPPARETSGGPTWTHTRGSTRISPDCHMRSEDNTWHLTHKALGLALHRVAWLFIEVSSGPATWHLNDTTPDPPLHGGKIQACHLALLHIVLCAYSVRHRTTRALSKHHESSEQTHQCVGTYMPH
jgi:hypothetical protein